MDKEKNTFYKSKLFASRIIKLYRFLCEEKKEFVISKQLLRSGTSVGANLAESIYAASRKDFLNKEYIALKECGETLYWLDLLYDNDYLSRKEYDSIFKDCDELRKMLSAATKTISSTINHKPSTIIRAQQ